MRAWFDDAAAAIMRDDDGTLATARIAADASGGPRRRIQGGPIAPRSRLGRDRDGLPCLRARAADVVAFPVAERGRGLSVTTAELCRAAIRYLHLARKRAATVALDEMRIFVTCRASCPLCHPSAMALPMQPG